MGAALFVITFMKPDDLRTFQGMLIILPIGLAVMVFVVEFLLLIPLRIYELTAIVVLAKWLFF